PRTWGGRRKGAGRKKGPSAGVPHRARPPLASRFPVHVVLRVAPRVWNLRARRCFQPFAAELYKASPHVRVVEFSVQGNHAHLIVEAADAPALSFGVKGLSVRLARRLN